MPDAQRQTVTVVVNNLDGVQQLTVAIPSAKLAGRRLTLAYAPATPDDVALVNAYGGFYKTPPYLLGVHPIVAVDGTPLAVGPAVQMAAFQQVRVLFSEPGGGTDAAEHFVAAGSFADIGLEGGTASAGVLKQCVRTLDATLHGHGTFRVEALVGQLLQCQAQTYYGLLAFNADVMANETNLVSSHRTNEMLMRVAPTFVYALAVSPRPSPASARTWTCAA